MGDKIKTVDLCKTFVMRETEIVAVSDVSLAVPEGTFLCIVGPSGCGKTTLLRILAGLEKQTSGTVEIAQGRKGAPLTSVVFQEQSVFPWLTVYDNVAFGLAVRGVPKQVQRDVVEHYIARVGLGKFARSYPHQLSGGMKQRVNIARAFANDPEVLLMDEPFASLDEQNKLLLEDELLAIWEESRKTVVYITHSIEEAVVLGDRVLVMTAQPGRIKTVIDVDLPRPRDVFETTNSARYAVIRSQIWKDLRDEVLQSKERDLTGSSEVKLADVPVL